LTFGLLPGFAIGRLGCSLVHDHPGRAVAPDTWLALGPWPDGAWRHDLATIELAGLVVVAAVVFARRGWHRAPPGQLTGAVAITYGVGRFALDFLRAADARYLGLTPAQLACLAFVAGGLWLLRTRYDGRVERRVAHRPAGSGRPARAPRRPGRGRAQ
jgi:phosphatidylglycerol:prolipoprotein diacylglycerol transferase